jgi:hypothetical protein
VEETTVEAPRVVVTVTMVVGVADTMVQAAEVATEVVEEEDEAVIVGAVDADITMTVDRTTPTEVVAAVDEGITIMGHHRLPILDYNHHQLATHGGPMLTLTKVLVVEALSVAVPEVQRVEEDIAII